MKCQNVGIGDALYHSIKAAASAIWPAFGAQSKIINIHQGGRIRIPNLENGSVRATSSFPPPILYPRFEYVWFEPANILGLPSGVQLDYNEVIDTLVIAIRPGGLDETE